MGAGASRAKLASAAAAGDAARLDDVAADCDARGLTRADKDGWTALHYAAAAGAADAVAVLLSHGVAPAPRAADGSTPLHLAALAASPAAIKALVRVGASVSDLDDAGRSPLAVAAAVGAAGAAAELARAGADAGGRMKVGRDGVGVEKE